MGMKEKRRQPRSFPENEYATQRAWWAQAHAISFPAYSTVWAGQGLATFA